MLAALGFAQPRPVTATTVIVRHASEPSFTTSSPPPRGGGSSGRRRRDANTCRSRAASSCTCRRGSAPGHRLTKHRFGLVQFAGHPGELAALTREQPRCLRRIAAHSAHHRRGRTVVGERTEQLAAISCRIDDQRVLADQVLHAREPDLGQRREKPLRLEEGRRIAPHVADLGRDAGPCLDGNQAVGIGEHVLAKLETAYQDMQSKAKQSEQAAKKVVDDFVSELVKVKPEPQAAAATGSSTVLPQPSRLDSPALPMKRIIS